MNFRFLIFDLRLLRRGGRCAPESIKNHKSKIKNGFTLVELVLVLMVIALVMALAAPSLQGWGRGVRIDNAAEQFRSTAQWARSQAIATARVHRVQFDDQGRYRATVQQGMGFTVVAGEFGRWTEAGPGFRAIVIRADGDVGGAIDFHPSGRTTPARVQFIAPDGEVVEVAALSAAEPFR